MTTTKTKQITLAEVRKELKRIAADNPDAVNPTGFSGHGSPTCLYHKGRGRNISRCIIGQMGYNMGLPTPAAEAGGVDDVAEYGGVWTGMFTPKAVEYMVDVQAMADGVDAPIPWGQVKL